MTVGSPGLLSKRPSTTGAAARHAVKLRLAAEAPDGLGAELGHALEVLLAIGVGGDAGHLDERPQQVLEGGALPGGESFEGLAFERHVT